MKDVKVRYAAPEMDVIELQMEQCIMTDSYGEPGMPGQGSGFINGDDI